MQRILDFGHQSKFFQSICLLILVYDGYCYYLSITQKTIFQKEPERAEELLKIGESPRDSAIPAQEHATWTVLASMILNLDETLNRE